MRSKSTLRSRNFRRSVLYGSGTRPVGAPGSPYKQGSLGDYASYHKLHWLAEQALSWSGLPVVTVRPTVFLEGFFLLLAAASVRDADAVSRTYYERHKKC